MKLCTRCLTLKKEQVKSNSLKKNLINEMMFKGKIGKGNLKLVSKYKDHFNIKIDLLIVYQENQ